MGHRWVGRKFLKTKLAVKYQVMFGPQVGVDGKLHRGSRGRCWYAYYPYRAEFGEEFSTVAISGVLEPGASDPQMRDFSGTEI